MEKRFLTAQKVVEHLSANVVVSTMLSVDLLTELLATPFEVLLFVELDKIGVDGFGGKAGLIV